MSAGESDIARIVLKGPGVSDAAHYGKRVRWLAVVHAALFALSVTGFALLIWRGEFFVTLSQRTNVETLTIAFFLLFFGYFVALTAPGAWGALRILALHGNERRKQASLARRPRVSGVAAAFDKVLELEGRQGEPFEIDLRDDIGALGRLRFCGVKVQHLDSVRNGSNTLLAYVEQKLKQVTGQDISIVQWGSTAKEAMLQLVATADALCALGRKLDVATWPTLVISEAQRTAIEADLRAVCPALRSEAMLPDWEFEGEHKLPIIPEPLGIISLSRTEKRVDPLSAMAAAVAIVAIVVGLIVFFLVRPPWIPGR